MEMRDFSGSPGVYSLYGGQNARGNKTHAEEHSARKTQGRDSEYKLAWEEDGMGVRLGSFSILKSLGGGWKLEVLLRAFREREV